MQKNYVALRENFKFKLWEHHPSDLTLAIGGSRV
jgi:hypothetical protein